MTAQMKSNSDLQLKRYNLRSSSAMNYCFGLYTKRSKMLENDLNGVVEPIDPFMQKYVDFGNKHEKSGVAKWILMNKKMPQNILDNQMNYIIQNFLNLKGDTVVDLSCTPDGISGDTLLEIKCGKLGERPYTSKEITRYYPQIYLQQYILNSLGVEINKTHLVSWSLNGTKVWELKRNVEFEIFMLSLLEEYSMALLSQGELRDKPEKYTGDYDIKLIYGDE